MLVLMTLVASVAQRIQDSLHCEPARLEHVSDGDSEQDTYQDTTDATWMATDGEDIAMIVGSDGHVEVALRHVLARRRSLAG